MRQTVFHSWMLLVRGILRRTGPKGVSLRATGAWELSGLWETWSRGGLEAVHAALSESDEDDADQGDAAGGTGGNRRRMLVHASGVQAVTLCRRQTRRW
jgi:error-prone DNA polymerase